MLPSCAVCGCEVGGGAISVIRGGFQLSLTCSMACADEWEAVQKALEPDDGPTSELDVESMKQVQDGGLR